MNGLETEPQTCAGPADAIAYVQKRSLDTQSVTGAQAQQSLAMLYACASGLWQMHQRERKRQPPQSSVSCSGSEVAAWYM